MGLAFLEAPKISNSRAGAAVFNRRQGVVEATVPDSVKAAAVLRAINGYFTERARNRGHEISGSARISRLATKESPGGFDLQGLVTSAHSSDSSVVRFRGTNLIWDSTCSCSLSNDCPHACALAYTHQKRLAGITIARTKRSVVQRTKQRFVSSVSKVANRENFKNTAQHTDSVAKPEQAIPRIESGSKEALVNLLKELQKKPIDDHSQEPVPAAFVTYHLNLDHSGRLGLSVSSTRTDQGQLLKCNLTPSQLLKFAQRKALIDDALVARALLSSISLEENEISHFPPDQKRSNELLRQLLASGRLYWAEQEENPLLEGAARRAELVWTGADDKNKLVIKLLDDDKSETTTLFLDYALWYFDSSLNTIGPVVLDQALSNDALALLMSFPSIATYELPYAREYLEATDRDKQLPLPFVPDELIEKMRATDVQLSVRHARVTPVGARALATNATNLAIVTLKAGESWLESRSKRAIAGCLMKMGFEISNPSYFGCDADATVLLPLNHGSINHLGQLKKKMEALNWKVSIEQSEYRAVIDATSARWTAKASSAQKAWFDFSLGITVDGTHYWLFPIVREALKSLSFRPTVADIEKLNSDGIFYSPLPDGKLIALPFERIRNILSTLIQLFDESSADSGAAVNMPFSQVLLLLRGDSQIECADLDNPSNDDLNRLISIARAWNQSERSGDNVCPQGLKTTLREYQKVGLSWLQFLREAGIGGILADDMGLGKTVQALAHILLEKEKGRLTKPFLVICPTSLVPNWISEAKKLTPNLHVLGYQGAARVSRRQGMANFDVIVTTYQTILRDASILEEFTFHGIILDEAQAIKNSSARIKQIVSKLKCHHKISLTGTPIENHLGELWSHFDFLVPGLLGSQTHFNSTFRTPIERGRSRKKRELLASLLRPLILRRHKKEVASELPDKTVILHEIEMEESQRDLYETVRVSVQREVAAEIERKGLQHSQISILAALTKLRQVCCDPRLVKTIEGTEQVPSAKLAALLDLVIPLIEEGRRIIIFSQFTSMLDIIALSLQQNGIDFVELRGDTKDRVTPVDRFQNGGVPVFLISLKAGGVGLNLTAADTVIHYDPWWNPAVEDQATDRAHRIGQDKAVFVYKLIARGTVEEAMLVMQQKKRELTADFLGGDRSSSAITPEELKELLASAL